MSKKINLEFNKNEDGMKLAVSDMRKKLAVIEKGGGVKAIAKQHEKGKLTPRERIEYLIDKKSEFIELMAFAGYEMYADRKSVV